MLTLIQYIANKINYRFNNKVWFMIAEYARKYYICMYYDNGYNKADGEDL